MYVNTGGGGKTQQQQQPLQNQVRHNNPYQHTQQQPHYEHHQGPVAYFAYPYCNVAPAPHGNTGANNVGVVGGQAGQLLYQTSHQPSSQQLPTQQPVGLHNTEQTLHYFTKNGPIQPHHLPHAPQQHTQIRNLIATVPHQQQQYMVSQNYYTLSHPLLQQQTRASIIANAGPQHAVAAATTCSMAKQLQTTAPRNIAPSGPTAYVATQYCAPPLLLGSSPTAVAPQAGPLLTNTTGLRQPPPLPAYAHMAGGIPAAPAATSINLQTVGLGTGSTSSNIEQHSNTNTNTNTNRKQRKYAIAIINPNTNEIVPYEQLIDAQPQPSQQAQTQQQLQPQPPQQAQTQQQLQTQQQQQQQQPQTQQQHQQQLQTQQKSQPQQHFQTQQQQQLQSQQQLQPQQPHLQIQQQLQTESHSQQTHSEPQTQPQLQTQPQIQTLIKSETSVESVSMQTDNENKSLTDSIETNPSDVVLPVCSQSVSATQTDQIDYQMENKDNDYEEANPPNVAIETAATALHSITDANNSTQSLHSGSESVKVCSYEDPNDTDADTNEHELDNEDDVLVDTIDGDLTMPCIYQQFPNSNTNISIGQQTDKVTDANLLLQSDESDTDHSKETEAKSKDEQCTVSVQTSEKIEEDVSKEIPEDLQSSVSTFLVSESRKKKNRKLIKYKEKKQKKSKQQQNKPSSNTISIQNDENKTATVSDKKALESKTLPRREEQQPRFIRYSLKELRSFGSLPQSCKTPVVPCKKNDCISQIFVARQQHHLAQQTGINLQHRAQHSYHQMNFSESTDFVKRRTVGPGGFVARKHQDNNSSLSSNMNNNSEGFSSMIPAGAGANAAQNQKKMQVIRINLSLNEEIKLSESKNAWQPKVLTNHCNKNVSQSESEKNANDDMENVLKKVRGILNKLTAENFDVLLKEMTSITINTQEKMQKIMLLIFEKTVSEPNFAPTYAKFCKVLFDEVKAESKEVFNTLLLARLEKEFDSNVNNADAKERKLQQIINKLNEATDPQEKNELHAELEYQEYQFRRRAWGTVRFIGEMFKLRSVATNRVLLCVESLLKHGNDEKLEYMCKLLTTVGSLLEASDSKNVSSNARMNKIFKEIQDIVKDAKNPSKKKVKICSRVRFMMQDLIDLRSKNWGQLPSAPSSHTATVQRRIPPEDKNSNVPSGSMNTYERGSSQRMSFGNNNRQNRLRTTKESGAGGSYFMQNTSKKSQYMPQREPSIDMKKLNFSRGDDASPATTELGNSSTYIWRTVIGRQANQSNYTQHNDRNSPTPLQYSSNKNQVQQQQQQQTQYWNKSPNANSSIKTVLESCTNKDNQRLLNHLMEEYLDCLPSQSNRWQEEILDTWESTNSNQQICLIYYILMHYLHLADVNSLERKACANIFVYLMNHRNKFHKTVFTRAYEQFAEEFPDLLVDVPNGWTYTMQFLGPLLHDRLLTFNDIWHTNWQNDQPFTERFVNALVSYFTKEFGQKYMRDLWHKEFNLDQGQVFKNDQQQWRKFVAANKLQFLYQDSKTKPDTISTNANNT